MATRFDVVIIIKNPSLRVVGGSLRRPPIEVDEHYFHIDIYSFIMHLSLLRLLIVGGQLFEYTRGFVLQSRIE